jgi:hypothetical protein
MTFTNVAYDNLVTVLGYALLSFSFYFLAKRNQSVAAWSALIFMVCCLVQKALIFAIPALIPSNCDAGWCSLPSPYNALVRYSAILEPYAFLAAGVCLANSLGVTKGFRRQRNAKP